MYEVLTQREDGGETYTREKVRPGNVRLFSSDSCVRLTWTNLKFTNVSKVLLMSPWIIPSGYLQNMRPFLSRNIDERTWYLLNEDV